MDKLTAFNVALVGANIIMWSTVVAIVCYLW